MTMLNHGHRAPADVIAWRRTVLQQAGFVPRLAGQLAAEADVDLHDLLNLVDQGCPPDLAARILIPLRTSLGDEAAPSDARSPRP
jgi:hypothetical protein